MGDQTSDLLVYYLYTILMRSFSSKNTIYNQRLNMNLFQQKIAKAADNLTAENLPNLVSFLLQVNVITLFLYIFFNIVIDVFPCVFLLGRHRCRCCHCHTKSISFEADTKLLQCFKYYMLLELGGRNPI